jgi:hypothetical protein
MAHLGEAGSLGLGQHPVVEAGEDRVAVHPSIIAPRADARGLIARRRRK